MKFAIKYYFLPKKDPRLLSKKNKCIIFMAANYGNYGDIAITESQKKYLKDLLPNYDIISYDIKESIYYLKMISHTITSNDIITIIGGGNFGDTYMPFERARRYIVKKLKKFNIISFPQTISFSSKIELNKSLHTYKNSKLVVAVREGKSYSTYKKNFEKMILVPDIVLYNSVEHRKKNITGKIAFIFRDDKEKSTEDSYITELYNVAKQYGEIFHFDTTFPVKDSFDNYSVLTSFLDYVATFDFIFTDRLHAMIFGYILNIPTVVLDNANGKIGATYETWLNESERVFYIGNKWDNLLKEELVNFLTNAHEKKDNDDLKCYFNRLTDVIYQQVKYQEQC